MIKKITAKYFYKKLYSNVYSVRGINLRLIVKNKNKRKELYNLKNDNSESNNFA